MEEEEQGVTLGDICKVVFKRVWWVVGAIALGVILAALLVQFWYNKNNRTYSVTYQIVYANSDSGKYPDGSTFVMSDLISEQALQTVIDNDTDGDFKDIDIEKLLDDDGVTIADVTEDTTATLKSYTLTLSAKYFSSKEQAASFIRALAEYPIENKVVAGVKNKSFDTYLTAYELAESYEDMIEALTAQAEYIDEYYDTLISLYGTEYPVTVDGKTKTLGQWQSIARSAFSEEKEKTLSLNLSSGYYATDEYLENLDERATALAIQIKEYKSYIDAYQGTANNWSDSEVVGERLVELIDAQQALQVELDRIPNIKTESAKYTTSGTDEYTAYESFKTSLESSKTALEEKAAETQKVVTSLYTASSRIAYDKTTVTVDGGINIVLAALIGAVLGLIVAAVVICIIDMPAYKREKYGIGAPAHVAALPEGSDPSTPATAPADDPTDKKE